MKKIKKFGALLFFSLYLIIGLSTASLVLAAEVNTAQFTPQVSIPGSEFQEGTSTPAGHASGTKITSDLLARYIKAFYNWGLSIVGVLAVLMLMAGGVTWLTSGGDSGKIGDAKKMISGSILGTFLLVGAYFFLNTINPDLTKLPAISVDNLKNIQLNYLVCCSPTKGEVRTQIKIENGKNIALEGNLKGKAITCGQTAKQCDNSTGERCLPNTEDSYSCMVDNWCCQCKTGLVFNACKINVDRQSCIDWCGDWTGKVAGWEATFYDPKQYMCDGDKCIK